jgi:hypothetical protein
LVLFNEPYFYTLSAIGWHEWGGRFRLPLFLLIDEDSTHIQQDFWTRVENFARLVRELHHIIKREMGSGGDA